MKMPSPSKKKKNKQRNEGKRWDEGLPKWVKEEGEETTQVVKRWKRPSFSIRRDLDKRWSSATH